MSSHQLNSKHNAAGLFFATDGKGGHGLKLEKVGPTFSSFHAIPAKMIKKRCDKCSLGKLN